MFEFFRKKYFVADFLGGLTDFHCHLLPGLDDGSKDIEMSLDMIAEYKSIGYTGAVATPHVMEGFYHNDSETILKSLASLKKVCLVENIDFNLSAAAEYMLDKEFDQLCEAKDLLKVFENKVLVEMSYLQKAIFVESQIFDIQQKGFTPILAHPERYLYLTNRTDVLKFKEKGCLLQLNLLSLSNHYGSQVQNKAFELLSHGHYDLVGTDAHNPRHLRTLKHITLTKKYVPFFEALIQKVKEINS